MLRKIRIAIAALSVMAVALLFLDFTGYARAHWGWLADIQALPALLSLNVVALIILITLTLLLGRVYCSVICPLGIMQDGISWLRGRLRPKKKRRLGRFGYKPQAYKTRYIAFGIFAVLLILGLLGIIATSIAGMVDPYSIFGRITTGVAAPGYDAANNALADYAAANDSYAFYHTARTVSWWVAIVGGVALLAIAAFAWIGGRDYCNKICPVGTMLGWLSRYAWLRPAINVDKCTGCRRCARSCKAQCIDPVNHAIDYTRCVDCMDCVEACSEGALTYTHIRYKNEPQPAVETVQQTRRNFLITGATVAGAMALNASPKVTDGGTAHLQPKGRPERATRVVPPGALSIKNLTQHCTACQLCIDNCPNGVLSASTSLENFLQPEMNFAEGYCRPECNICSQVCPAGAITPIDTATKSAIQIGRATVDYDACISAAGGQTCGHCAHQCPTGAITMIVVDGNKRPTVNAEVCIGCGACEYHCPVGRVVSLRSKRPAIHVEGNAKHRLI